MACGLVRRHLRFEKVEETAKQLREVLGEMPILFTFRTSKEGGEKAIETPVYVELNQKISATGYVDLVDMKHLQATMQ